MSSNNLIDNYDPYGNIKRGIAAAQAFRVDFSQAKKVRSSKMIMI
jgi:hypothetical protein